MAETDIEEYFLHLYQSDLPFGHDPSSAIEMTVRRSRKIDDYPKSLQFGPHQGTCRPEIAPNLRSATKNRTIFYFEIDEDVRGVTVLAIFFGGQDHESRILSRLNPPS